MSEPCCPRCGEPVRLPAVIPSADAAVRCPWCGGQFGIGEVTAKLPPMLELLPVDADVSGAAAAGSAFDDLQAQNDWEEPFAEPVDDDVSVIDADDPFSFAPDPTVQPPATGLGGMHVATRPRAQRRVSVTKALVQWVGGGVAGIAIALAILYAIGKPPELGFWPFDGSAASDGGPPPRPFVIDPQPRATVPEGQELPLPDFQTIANGADDEALDGSTVTTDETGDQP